MNPETLVALGSIRARVWDARHGINTARDTFFDIMQMTEDLPKNPVLCDALKKAEDAIEDALREIYNQIEEAEE